MHSATPSHPMAATMAARVRTRTHLLPFCAGQLTLEPGCATPLGRHGWAVLTQKYLRNMSTVRITLSLQALNFFADFCCQTAFFRKKSAL